MTERTMRRSPAVGARSAISRDASSPIFSSSASIALSPIRTFSASSSSRASSAWPASRMAASTIPPMRITIAWIPSRSRSNARMICWLSMSVSPSADPAGDVAFGARIARIGEDLAGLTVLDEIAEMEERRPLAHPRSLLHRVGHDHHRELRAKLVDQLFHLGGGDRVERGTGFVHQQHLGRGRDGPRDAKALLLAARKAGARRGKPVLRLVPQRGTPQRAFDDLVELGLVAGQPVDLRAVGHVLVDR